MQISCRLPLPRQKSAILEVAQLQQSIFGGLDRQGLCFLDQKQFVDVDLVTCVHPGHGRLRAEG